MLNFIKLMFIFFSLLPFANAQSDVEGIISYTPKALEYGNIDFGNTENPDISEFTIHADESGYVLYSIVQEKGPTSIQCHYHAGGNTHCLDTFNEHITLSSNVEELVNVSGAELQMLFSNLNIDYTAAESSLWPWAIGVAVSYYFAKKALNFWLFRSFTLPDAKHNHSHFFLDSVEQLKKRIQEESQISKTKITRLTNVSKDALNMNVALKGLSEHLNEKLLTISGELLKDLQKDHKHSCSTCDHHDHHDHHDHDHKTQHETSEAKKSISNGLILKYTKALMIDLKKEFIEPFLRAAKAGKQFISDPFKRGQVNAFAQTRFRVFTGETRLAVAATIATLMTSIKISGESLETILFGPLHVLCQISDLAAATAGLSIFVSYHCLRQPFRKKDPKLLLNKTFWKVFIKRLSTPFKNELSEDELKNATDGLKLFVSEIYKTKKSLEKLIWMHRHDQNLTLKKANDFASELGAINKIFENAYFDIKILGANLSKEELLNAVKNLAHVTDAYEELNYKILDQATEKSMNSSKAMVCRELLI